MKVTINSNPSETSAANLMELSEELSLPAKGVAVAIDNRMIPRDKWSVTSLSENANIVIIKAACGG